ncbi:BTAD domain-containing putative transcriptional regulator [Streptomyces sedi]
MPGPGARCVLGVLLLEPGQTVSVERLIEACWGQEPPSSARGALQVRVSHLRRHLPGLIETGSGGYRVVVGRDQVDVHRFRGLVAAASTTADPAEALRRWRAALDCWSGEPMAGVHSRWVDEMVRRPLWEERWSVVERLAGALVELGRHREAVAELRGLLRHEPFREGAHVLLMRALWAEGRRAEALDAFRAAREVMVAELGIEPGPELTELHGRILREDAEPPPNGGEGQRAPGPPPVTPPAPRQLPAQSGLFVGHAELLAALDQAEADRLRQPEAASGPVLLTGMGGVGKTRLALHWARLRADSFPEGQLFVNLRGYGAGRPVSPTAALEGFLRALGVDRSEGSRGLDELAALFRSTVAGRRVLVVLDNAHDAEQVRPLLPGAGCTTLITSRHRLPGLIGRDAGRRITVPGLATGEGRLLLADMLGEERVAREPEAAAALTELCAGLPLALRVVADRLSSVPGAGLGEVVGELRDGRDRLAAFSADDDLGSDLRTIFRASYRELPEDLARVFRLLALLPPERVSVAAVAALTGWEEAVARRAMDRLHAHHLVEQPAWARYELHDLLRVFAHEEAVRQESEEQRSQAITRVVDWYTTSAHHAMGRVRPRDRAVEPPRLTKAPVAEFADRGAALAWCDEERATLLALPELALAHGLHRHAWYLPWTLFSYFSTRRLFDAWVSAGETALAAATALRDPAAEGRALNLLGPAYVEVGRTKEAEAVFRRAVAVFRAARDEYSEAAVANNLGTLHIDLGAFGEALNDFTRARELYGRAGSTFKEAVALAGIGWAQVGLERWAEAIRHLEAAVEAMPLASQAQARAEAFDQLGVAHAGDGAPERAVDAWRQAADLYASCEDWHYESEVRSRLGAALLELGDVEAARRSLRRARDLAERLGGSGAALGDLETRLSRLPGHESREAAD